jgi:putative ABC transport system permease protein
MTLFRFAPVLVALLACVFPMAAHAQSDTVIGTAAGTVIGTVIGTPAAPLVAGRAAPDVRGIAIDERIADDHGVAVGDTLRLAAEAGTRGELVRVDAIVRRAADPSEVARSEYRVRLHLDQLQQLTGSEDRVDRFAVALRDSGGTEAVDSALARINHLAFGFRAHASRDVAVESSRTFQVVDRFHRAIGGITIVASAVFLLCILLLKVEERRRAIAALRLAGLSRRTVALSVIAEAAVISVVGSVIGAGLGWVVTLAVNAHYQRLFRTPLTFAVLTPGITLFAVTLSLVLGIVAGALAAWRLVRTPPLVLLGR